MIGRIVYFYGLLRTFSVNLSSLKKPITSWDLI